MPSSARIIQDTNKFLTSLETIRNAGGIVVPGLGGRCGHRAEAAVDRQVEQRGGLRVKGSGAAAKAYKGWLHKDAQAGRELLSKRAVSRHAGTAPLPANR